MAIPQASGLVAAGASGDDAVQVSRYASTAGWALGAQVYAPRPLPLVLLQARLGVQHVHVRRTAAHDASRMGRAAFG